MENPGVNKYVNSKIYKIISDFTDKIYIGSTIGLLHERLSSHRKSLKSYLEQKTSYYSSYELLNQFEDCQIILIESYPCNSKEELRARERYHIEQNREICVNMKLQEKARLWRAKNIERFKEWEQKYRTDYLEERKAYEKEYREAHREQLNDSHRQYYNENREKLLAQKKVPVTCECGLLSKRGNLNKHFKTKIHQERMNQLQKK